MLVNEHLKLREDLITIDKNATFREALSLMVQQKTNGLVVLNKRGKVVGTIDSFNLIQAMVPSYLQEDASLAALASDEVFQKGVNQSLEKPVKQMMEKVGDAYVRESDNMILAAAIAAKYNARYIPVFKDDSDEIAGVVSRTDIKRAMADILQIHDEQTNQ